MRKGRQVQPSRNRTIFHCSGRATSLVLIRVRRVCHSSSSCGVGMVHGMMATKTNPHRCCRLFLGRMSTDLRRWDCGERRIRTYKPLRAPVFKTGAIAVLPALRIDLRAINVILIYRKPSIPSILAVPHLLSLRPSIRTNRGTAVLIS